MKTKVCLLALIVIGVSAALVVAGNGWEEDQSGAAKPTMQVAGEKKTSSASSTGGSPAGPAGMVQILGGSFMMGCSPGDKECKDDEQPPHQVAINTFWMDAAEVTNAQYQQCVGAGKCKSSKYANDAKWNEADQPVVGVDWNDANDYCQWAGKRLPTEAEWEYAACGGAIGPRYGNVNSIAWYTNNSGNATHAVKQKEPNAYGLYDMLGNAWEWCADWYDGKYYSSSNSKNPKGPGSGTSRVVRGGSWYNNSGHARTSKRYSLDPAERYFHLGLRCSRDLSPDR